MAFGARFTAFCTLVAFGLLIPLQAGADDRHRQHRVVVFGDSLSDPGNAFALNGGVTVSPPTYGMDGVSNGLPEVITLIPEAPYGSRRFSNGRTGVEREAGRGGRLDRSR